MVFSDPTGGALCRRAVGNSNQSYAGPGPAQTQVDLTLSLEDGMGARKALVCGAGGFIGSHMSSGSSEGYWVRGVDLKRPEFGRSAADDFVVGDLREVGTWEKVLDARFDEAYQFAADMGGAGIVFTGENDAEIMHNSAMINLHMTGRGLN
jgi:hypothetical protein